MPCHVTATDTAVAPATVSGQTSVGTPTSTAVTPVMSSAMRRFCWGRSSMAVGVFNRAWLKCVLHTIAEWVSAPSSTRCTRSHPEPGTQRCTRVSAAASPSQTRPGRSRSGQLRRDAGGEGGFTGAPVEGGQDRTSGRVGVGFGEGFGGAGRVAVSTAARGRSNRAAAVP